MTTQKNEFTLKTTALTHIHEKLNAKMVEFAGYSMPVQYAGVKIEHKCVREGVGVFDVSHMGEFFVTGEGSFDLLQKVTSNDVSKLFPGKAQYSCLPNEEGGIVDDLIVYMIAENNYLLVVNASNIQKDWDWINKHNSFGATLTDRSDEYSLLAIQGPKAAEAMQSLTKVDLANMKFYTFEIGDFAGESDVIISATGYTGSGGFEIYVPNKSAEKVWAAVLEAGKDFDIQPIGLAARDTLRLEKGYCLYGNDIDDTTSPYEAGLGWITKPSTGFINSENLKRQKEEGIKRRLVGFELIDRGVPRNGYEIVDVNGNKIGYVTSGTQSPTLDKPIGLGYVSVDFSHEGAEIHIAVRKKQLKAKVVKIPFE